MTPFIVIIFAAIILLVTTAAYLTLQEARTREVHARIDWAVGNPGKKTPNVQGFLASFGKWLQHFYTTSSLEKIRNMVESAGFNPHRMIPLLLASKMVLMLLVLLIAATTTYFENGILIRLTTLGGGVILGIMGPEWILAIIRRRHAVALERGTPDALDLLVVCSEAGMGLESALERVSHETQRSNSVTSSALTNFLNDLRVLSRRDALANLSARSGAEGMRRFGTMLGQSLQYGTPLGDALRAIADELRRDRMNKLEERAVKLPAKLIFPLIFFIMPSLYIVLLGTSFMRLYDALQLVVSIS
jgi:tight adherence protein C